MRFDCVAMFCSLEVVCVQELCALGHIMKSGY